MLKGAFCESLKIQFLVYWNLLLRTVHNNFQHMTLWPLVFHYMNPSFLTHKHCYSKLYLPCILCRNSAAQPASTQWPSLVTLLFDVLRFKCFFPWLMTWSSDCSLWTPASPWERGTGPMLSYQEIWPTQGSPTLETTSSQVTTTWGDNNVIPEDIAICQSRVHTP